MSIKIGSPTVNGQAAASAPGPNVQSGKQVIFTIPVTNTGTVPVSGLTSTPEGQLSGPKTLQPGQTANYTITTSAKPGNNTASFNITAVGPNGQQQSKSCRLHYNGFTAAQPQSGAPQSSAPQSGQPSGVGKVALTGSPKVDQTVVNPQQPVALSSNGQTTVQVHVTNTGNAPITNLQASSSNGQVTCAVHQLPAGATTTCTLTFTPGSGAQQVKMTFTGQDAAGNTSTASYTLNYTDGSSQGSASGSASSPAPAQAASPSSSGSPLSPVTSLVGGV